MNRLQYSMFTVVLTSVVSLTVRLDAAEDTWTYKADMPTARGFVSGCVVDGKVYVIGGFPTASSVSAAVERYDPVTDTWSQLANMPAPRRGHATCAWDGKIYVFGGASPSPIDAAQKNVYVYDPPTDTWTQRVDMPYANFMCGVAVVGPTIYLVGGMPSASSPPVARLMVYDPGTESWTRKADMPTARAWLSASMVDGKIYAIGGAPQNYGSVSYRNVEVYDPSTDTWTRKSDMPTGRAAVSTCVVDGKIFALGGYSPSGVCTVNELYDPVADAWTVKTPMQQKRLMPFAGSVGDKVYVIGGSYPSAQMQPIALAITEEYDTGLVPPDPCEATAQAVDFDGNERIDFRDFSRLALSWRDANMVTDVAPWPAGDGIVDFNDLAVLAKFWLHDAALPIYITWMGHASVKIAWSDQVIYVDPVDIVTSPHDATLLLVTHSHSDHYAPASIDRVAGPAMQVIAPAGVATSYPRRQSIAPGQTITLPSLKIIAVAAYNINKSNHPKSSNWVGFIVEIGSRRIYCAGDTDLTPEMKALTDIDVAFLPAGGTYTMTATEAADATKYFMPGLAIPYHWGRSVGTLADAQLFAQKAACPARVMTKGETISSPDWNTVSPPSSSPSPPAGR